jgi:hypothetical protein
MFALITHCVSHRYKVPEELRRLQESEWDLKVRDQGILSNSVLIGIPEVDLGVEVSDGCNACVLALSLLSALSLISGLSLLNLCSLCVCPGIPA